MKSNIKWFENEKKDFFKKGFPKKEGSGGGIRLNKGREGCSLKSQEKFGKGKTIQKRDFDLKDAIILGGSAILLAEAVDVLNN